MPLIFADRVKETTLTIGTGQYALEGAAIGHQSFSDGIGNTNTCYYAVTDGVDWEIGIGTVGVGTLDRTTIHASSNAAAAVNWAVGVKTIFCTVSADAITKAGSINIISAVSTHNAAGNEYVLCDATGGVFSVNLPAAASNTNALIVVKKIDASANAITIDANLSETIDGSLTQLLSTQYDALTLVCDGSNWFIV